MGLIKKVDVDKHFAARRAMRLGRSGPLSDTGFRIERAAKTTSAAVSNEDVAAPPKADNSDEAIVSTDMLRRQS
jgi:hypothetical protein